MAVDRATEHIMTELRRKDDIIQVAMRVCLQIAPVA